jgi:hypothetical protein
VHALDATIFMVKFPDEKSFGTELGALILPQADTRNAKGTHSFLITGHTRSRLSGRLSHCTRNRWLLMWTFGRRVSASPHR